MLNQTEPPAAAKGGHFPSLPGRICVSLKSVRKVSCGFHRGKTIPKLCLCLCADRTSPHCFCFLFPWELQALPHEQQPLQLGIILLQDLHTVPVGNKSPCVTPVGGTARGHLALQSGLFNEQHRETGRAIPSGSEMAPAIEHRAGGCPSPR